MTNIIQFQDKKIRTTTLNGQIALSSMDLAKGLGYSDSSSVTRIYGRHKDEFSKDMVGTVKMTVQGNLISESLVFSTRGCHLIAMFARTEFAKDFRKWILDVLENYNTPQQQQGSLPFTPVSLTASDFIHNKEVMKAVGGLVKRCCAMAIREAFRDMFKTEFSKVTLEELLKRCYTMAIHESFSEIFKIEPVKLTFNKNNKHSKELNVIAEAIINYGNTEYKKGKVEGILTSIFDDKLREVSKKVNI